MSSSVRFWHWLGIVVLLGVIPACGPTNATNTDVLRIGAYSVVREVFHDGLLPAFAAEWKSRTGRDVEFEESYNASGAQARAIASGFDADLAVLSLEGDIELLVKAGLVKPSWNAGPDQGIITHSLVVIGIRPGNPKRIHDWADLARPGVGVLYPDPKTSGGARWNINAIYGAALLASREANEGQARPRGRSATCWPGSRPTSSTWTRRAGRAWPTSRARDRRRGRHLRERAAAPQQGEASRSPT